MYDGVTSAIDAWVRGNWESVINWLWQQKPHVVALFCREFAFGEETGGFDSFWREGQLNIICNRLQDKFAADLRYRNDEQNPQSHY